MDRALMTICDRRYLPGALALLRSAHRHHPDVKLYCFVPEEDVEIARNTLGTLAEVRKPSRQIRGVPKKYQAMEAKLMASQLDHETVVIVDADVVLCGPAEELWNIEPGRVRAVADINETLLENVPPDLREDFSARYPRLSALRPFNAGVIGLRPRDWPNLLEDFESELSAYQYDSYHIMFDQMFLNVILLESCDFLPSTYNVLINLEESIPQKSRVLHFCCSPKPWAPNYARWHPEYYLWARYGLVTQNPLVLGGIYARSAYVRFKGFIARPIRKNQLAKRFLYHLGYRPYQDVSFWDDTSFQVPVETASDIASTH